MNSKGFSLVELLAIITILGLIMGVAVISQQKHVTKTRQAAYDTLITTARTAAQNRLIDEGIDSNYCKAYSIEELYASGYMDKPADPASTSEDCGGHVLIRASSNSDLIENYDIDVILECSTYTKEDCKDTGGEACSYSEDEKSYCLYPVS